MSATNSHADRRQRRRAGVQPVVHDRAQTGGGFVRRTLCRAAKAECSGAEGIRYVAEAATVSDVAADFRFA
nr:hypothetical protein [Paenibacillus sp. BJ-4]